jgi:toxin ParE1/3/4
LVQDTYLASLGYRSINVKNYTIFYIIGSDDTHIKVVRFLYKKRNWMNVLKESNEEDHNAKDD